jgi:GNAT superfamily N-acetyltransferase
MVSTVEVRPASPADLAALVDVEQAANARFVEIGRPRLAQAAIPADVAHRAIDEGRLTVAVVDGRVVGWVLTNRLGGEPCIGELVVVPQFGRRGVGGALLHAAVEWARAQGEESVVLATQHDVRWNAPWYASHGFEVVDRSRWSPAMGDLADEFEREGIPTMALVFMRLPLGRPR